MPRYKTYEAPVRKSGSNRGGKYTAKSTGSAKDAMARLFRLTGATDPESAAEFAAIVADTRAQAVAAAAAAPPPEPEIPKGPYPLGFSDSSYDRKREMAYERAYANWLDSDQSTPAPRRSNYRFYIPNVKDNGGTWH